MIIISCYSIILPGGSDSHRLVSSVSSLSFLVQSRTVEVTERLTSEARLVKLVAKLCYGAVQLT